MHPRESDGPVRPPLGGRDIEPLRRCTRLVGYNPDRSERLCDKPAAVHVDWGEHAGFVCAEHRAELGTRWTTQADHLLGPYCGMPGALWFSCTDGSSYCAYEDGLPTVPALARESRRRMPEPLPSRHSGSVAVASATLPPAIIRDQLLLACDCGIVVTPHDALLNLPAHTPCGPTLRFLA